MKLFDYSTGFIPNHSTNMYCLDITDFVSKKDFGKIGDIADEMKSLKPDIDIAFDVVPGFDLKLGKNKLFAVMCSESKPSILEKAGDKFGIEPEIEYVNPFDRPEEIEEYFREDELMEGLKLDSGSFRQFKDALKKILE